MAVRRGGFSGEECAACGRAANNSHHVIPKGSPYFGDDVEPNIVRLDGSGTHLCHGAFHGSPYVDRAGVRWTRKKVARAIGVYIGENRPDTVAYALEKLGDGPGRDYLRRVYRLVV